MALSVNMASLGIGVNYLCDNCKIRPRTYGKNPKTNKYFKHCYTCYKNLKNNQCYIKCITCNLPRKYGKMLDKNDYWKYCGGSYCKNCIPRCKERGCHNNCILLNNYKFASYCDGNHCIKYTCNQTGCHNKSKFGFMWCSFHLRG